MIPDIELDDLSWDEREVEQDLVKHRAAPLLFGCISTEAIIGDLTAQEIDLKLAKKGYSELRVELPPLPVGQEGMRVSAAHAKSKERLCLMELKAYWGKLELPQELRDGDCRVLVWDWLELCDPMASFSKERAALPGQSAPGLDMFDELVSIMRGYVLRTDAQALVTIPQYFHNAVIYQRQPDLEYRFLDPLRQGQLRAQMRDLMSVDSGFYSATWAFEEGRVEALAPGVDPDVGWEAYAWTPSELVLPLSSSVRKALSLRPEEAAQGELYRFRTRSTPHPSLDGSFHLAG